MTDHARCGAMNRFGQQCKKRALAGEHYCAVHLRQQAPQAPAIHLVAMVGGPYAELPVWLEDAPDRPLRTLRWRRRGESAVHVYSQRADDRTVFDYQGAIEREPGRTSPAGAT